MKLLLLFYTNNTENKHKEWKQRKKPSQDKKDEEPCPIHRNPIVVIVFWTIFFFNTNWPSTHTKPVNPLTESASVLKPMSRVI